MNLPFDNLEGSVRETPLSVVMHDGVPITCTMEDQRFVLKFSFGFPRSIPSEKECSVTVSGVIELMIHSWDNEPTHLPASLDFIDITRHRNNYLITATLRESADALALEIMGCDFEMHVYGTIIEWATEAGPTTLESLIELGSTQWQRWSDANEARIAAKDMSKDEKG